VRFADLRTLTLVNPASTAALLKTGRRFANDERPEGLTLGRKFGNWCLAGSVRMMP